MPRTARTADIHQDRQLAVLLDLALSLDQSLTEQDLLQAGATVAQVGQVMQLLTLEMADGQFLRQPLVKPRQWLSLRFGAAGQVLEYSPAGAYGARLLKRACRHNAPTRAL